MNEIVDLMYEEDEWQEIDYLLTVRTDEDINEAIKYLDNLGTQDGWDAAQLIRDRLIERDRKTEQKEV